MAAGDVTAGAVLSPTVSIEGSNNPSLRLFESGTETSYSEITDASSTQMLIQKTLASGALQIDISPIASDGSSNALVRLFRGTNTSGTRALHVHRGDGTATVDIALIPNGESYINTGSLGIGTTNPNNSSILDLTSTTGALLLPRMTTGQRDALTAANGMVVYNTTTATIQGYFGGAWANL